MTTNPISVIPYRGYDIFRGMRLLRRAEAIIVNSSIEEEEVRSFFGARAPTILRIPAGLEPVKNPQKIPHVGIAILFVARITKDRDPAILIKAFQEVAGEFAFATLRIVGGEVVNSAAVKGGVVRRARRLVAEGGLVDRVLFLGELHGERLEYEYRSADIFAYNSRTENFGQTILNAASYGLAIVSSDVGVAHDLIENGKDGLLVKGQGSVASQFASHFRRLLGDAVLRESLGTKARDKSIQRFGWDRISDRYDRIYSALLGGTKIEETTSIEPRSTGRAT